jgi:superfamily II DNA or RNA helicase
VARRGLVEDLGSPRETDREYGNQEGPPGFKAYATTRDSASMSRRATDPKVLNLLAPGARVIVRDQEWQVEEVEHDGMSTRALIRCTGRSELVRGQRASFFTDIDKVEPEDPAQTVFRIDTSPAGIESRLMIESLIRRTPLPVSTTEVMVGHKMLADDLPFQREPFRVTTQQLQPRLLIADAVGLGKTLEVGIILSELQRRGRANRVLAVVPRHILDQVQHELWCRFGFPLVRLDSEGIQRLRQRIPAGRNPFAYYNRAIVSIDTLKQPGRYRHHLEKVRWDAVWIDESHKLVNRNTLNNQLAQVLAPNADALILTSATPHNGKAESFAELVSLLDPTAVPDPAAVTAKDIEHLVVRRHKHSPDVAAAIGDRWAERAEPKPVSVRPSAAEEAVFTRLSSEWLDLPEGQKAPCPDALFPYTLLKAALSSPAALAETVENRRTKRRTELLKNPDAGSQAELDALERLWIDAQEALDSNSEKIATLVATLKEIGVGPKSEVRAVIFSERIKTLDWIAEAVKTQLGLADEQVVTFSTAKTDEDQQQVVEDFSMSGAPVRVLVTSDIASEGVNLHKQCHHLIHFDLPWSLITLEQRNGRIDRYGQLHRPEIRYLVYDPATPSIASDIRVLSKLIEKENAAHKALGDVASVMGLYSEKAEESEIIDVLRKRQEGEKEKALESAAPPAASTSLWDIAGLGASASLPAVVESAAVGDVPSLFGDDAQFVEQAMRFTFDNLTEVDWETDGPVFSFVPPADLIRRLDSLPQSYLKQRNVSGRIRLTNDPARANQSLIDAINSRSDAGESGTAWPEIHFLGPMHPVIDWLSDKLLYRLDRNEALALVANVSEPTILVSGVWSNQMGEPIASKWLAATIDGGMVSFEDMFQCLANAGVNASLVNSAPDLDLTSLTTLLPNVVSAATNFIEGELSDSLTSITAGLERHAKRLKEWQVEARAVANAMAPGSNRTERLAEIDRTSSQMQALIAEHTPAQAPLIRVVGALLPKG